MELIVLGIGKMYFSRLAVMFKDLLLVGDKVAALGGIARDR